MIPKLIVVDLDGTTLNSKGVISKENKASLRKATEQNVEVAIATGRTFESARDFMKDIGITGHVVTLNGSGVRHIEAEDSLYHRYIEADLISEIMKINGVDRVNSYFSTSEKSYVIVKEREIYNSFPFNPALHEIDSLADLGEDGSNISKFLFSTSDNVLLENLNQKLKELALEAVYPDEWCLEVTAEGVSKASALAVLADELGITKHDIAAIGDSENDLEMIRYAGIGIAMENAMPSVKESAKYVTTHHNEDGVAYAVTKLLAGEWSV
ncbi:Cof-type HAD-IIB family hydrolase [Vagococcus sp. PNs007]|uniref:Cof-type HAD-IIB family hydrolase n=1 Tax=Vagococcus proximus TaxID=2991417 RepID=A0ABT5X282_9ENTE|nr:Cof-type HAD-IIB family hydrolase [Vagococcus proximus]MDF0480097.1 Cof-type HAD-IIB family hydrolase [Vagococcus proximus]